MLKAGYKLYRITDKQTNEISGECRLLEKLCTVIHKHAQSCVGSNTVDVRVGAERSAVLSTDAAYADFVPLCTMVIVGSAQFSLLRSLLILIPLFQGAC